jgi:hypothetical protein
MYEVRECYRCKKECLVVTTTGDVLCDDCLDDITNRWIHGDV